MAFPATSATTVSSRSAGAQSKSTESCRCRRRSTTLLSPTSVRPTASRIGIGRTNVPEALWLWNSSWRLEQGVLSYWSAPAHVSSSTRPGDSVAVMVAMLAMRSKSLSRCSTVSPAAAAAISRSESTVRVLALCLPVPAGPELLRCRKPQKRWAIPPVAWPGERALGATALGRGSV